MADNVDVEVKDILQNINRHVNCLGEENRNTRKRAIDGIRKEVFGAKSSKNPIILQGVVQEILKPVLKLLSDPVEKCREHSILFTTDAVSQTSNPELFLSLLIPVLVQRLGQQEITEPSEELRLLMVVLVKNAVTKVKKNIAPYVDELVKILQRTILDAYPEVKKESCKCACDLAKCIPEHFHMVSENLIKPLCQSISHQHSRVRVEIILAIGDVIQYGNGKSVDDVVSHLAQRLFDQAPTVRAAVIQVVGKWLLDLMDRYSFHHKLIPLLLTGMQDEVQDIRQQADSLWHDVGLKYEGENEDDLKDKQDFMKPDPEHYPPNLERPNLGCRTLVYRNFSKILSGVSNDITDWVVQTRVKSAALLYQLVVNEEDNVTQHLDKVLSALHRAASDEEREVTDYVVKCSELVGFFVCPEIWCKMSMKHIKLSQSPGSLLVLSSIIRGSDSSLLQAYIHDICNILSDPDLCRIAEGKLQQELLSCVESLLSVCGAMVEPVSLDIFTLLVTVLALHRRDNIKVKVYELLEKFSMACGLENVQALYSLHTRPLIDRLQKGYLHWTQHSVERIIFDTLLLESGPVVGELLEDVIPVLAANLHPDKDVDVKLKFFSLLSRLIMNAPATLDSQHRFNEFAVTVIKDMILPNLVWRAGRVATAIRTTAVSCLWAVVQSDVMTREKLLEVMQEMVTQLTSTLEDDNRNTRLVSCRVLNHIFRIVGTSLDQDKLHNMYPELLKRLDDSSDDIRVAMCKTFVSYFSCFESGYQVDLYRAHIESIYKGLLVHLDDPDQRIQEAVYEVLEMSATLAPEVLMRSVEEVKHKHRSTKWCDMLEGVVRNQAKNTG